MNTDIKWLSETVQALERRIAVLEVALKSISLEEYPVGGQPTRRQLSQIKMLASEALSSDGMKEES